MSSTTYKLQKLINKWRKQAEYLKDQGGKCGSPLVMIDKYHQAGVYEDCADQLEKEFEWGPESDDRV